MIREPITLAVTKLIESVIFNIKSNFNEEFVTNLLILFFPGLILDVSHKHSPPNQHYGAHRLVKYKDKDFILFKRAGTSFFIGYKSYEVSIFYK